MFQLMMIAMAKPGLSETLLSVLLHSSTSRRSLRAGAAREERNPTLGITYILQVLKEDNPVYSAAITSGLDLIKDVVQVYGSDSIVLLMLCPLEYPSHALLESSSALIVHHCGCGH